ncbi:TonB-dependent receptor [Bacteroidia bacterium]|nr:TonB-dependent receptor [Bacteroidia bacterium]GHT62527.1 TonB-dependent receptor [Bacteroidia bacterium]
MINKHLYSACFIFWTLLNPGYLAAQVVIEGSIYEKTTKEPLSHAVITLSDISGNDIVAYKQSDKNGFFSLQTAAFNDTLKLSVSLLGYSSESRLVTAKNQQFRFELYPKEIELREVYVKPPDIWKRGDTINYNVAELKSAQDRSIGDLLKKLPGVEVNESGGILYNGKPINKFYIEGLDLLESKYAIATNNVPVDAVSNVQVFENHQYVKALKDVVASEQAAINLKLKEGKMSRPIGKTKIGSGFSPFLWNLDLFGLQAAKERQTLVMYKANNTGHDIALDLSSHTLNFSDILSGIEPLPQDLLQPSAFESLDLAEKYYLFNRTHVLTLNNLWKLNEHSQFRVNINYLNDKRNQDLGQYSGYYLPDTDSLLSIEENNQLNNRTNLLETNLTFTKNSPETYLNNSLKFQGRWRDVSSDITGTNQVNQHFNIPLFYLQNDLNLVKHRGKKVFQFDSFTRYSTLPQQLNVTADTLNNPLSQDMARSTFYTNNKTSFGYARPSYNLLFDVQLQAKTENFDSDMNFMLFPAEGNNQIKTENLILYIGPQFTYRKDGFTLNFRLPLSSNNLTVKNSLTDDRKDYSFLFIEPSLSLRYKAGSFWTVNFNFQHKNETGDILDFPVSYYMTNYRYLRRGTSVLEKRQWQTYSLRAAYRNTIEAFFFNFSILYKTGLYNVLNNTSFRNGISLVAPIEFDNQRDNWSLNGYIAKYMDGIKTNFSLSGNYTRMKMERLQQNVKVPVTSQTVFLQPKIDMKATNRFSIAYHAKVLNNRTEINKLEQKNHNSLNQIGQQLKFFFFPSSRWQLNLQFEHLYNDITENLSSKLFFMDMGLAYQLKNMEFSLDWTNIFNQKSYAYTMDDGLNIFSRNYRLRPCSVMFNIHFNF